MTSAVYDLLYLNIIPIVFLSSDSINFSPIKNLKGSIFVNNVDAFNINNFKLPIKVDKEIADNLIKNMKHKSDAPPEGMYV